MIHYIPHIYIYIIMTQVFQCGDRQFENTHIPRRVRSKTIK